MKVKDDLIKQISYPVIPLTANLVRSERFYREKGIKVLDGNKFRLCLDIPGRQLAF